MSHTMFLHGLSPPVKHFYWRFQGDTFLWIICVILCLVFAMLSRLFMAALWSPEGKESADILALVCDVYCDFVTLQFGIIGQMFSTRTTAGQDIVCFQT